MNPCSRGFLHHLQARQCIRLMLRAPNEASPLLSVSNEYEKKQTASSSGSTTTAPIVKQWLAALGPLCGLISCGMASGFSAVLLPQLELPTSDIPVKDNMTSWITSSLSLSLAAGCSIAGYFSDQLGRRRSHQIISVVIATGWALQAGANDVSMLLAGRILTGIPIGIGMPLASVYLAEITSPRARGPILAAMSVCIATGILVIHVLGITLHWRVAAGIAIIFPAFMLLCATLCPDSPTWLIAQDEDSEAEKAFFWLRGNDDQARAELRIMKQRHRNWDARGSKEEQEAAELQRWLDTVKPFLVMCSYFVVQQWSGIYAVTFYSLTLLGAAVAGQGVMATIVVDTVCLIAAVVTSQLMWKYGRRPLTAVSGIGAGAVLILFSILLKLDVTSPFVLILLLSLYIIFICLGFMTVPWIMIGEVFPFTKRGITAGVTAAFNHIIAFSVLQSLPSLMPLIGAQGIFLLYGLVAFFGTLVLLIWLPETQNRTLDEIEYNITQTTEQTQNQP